MIRIGVTGATGFVGTHALSFLIPLERTGEVQTIIIPREAFSDTLILAELVSTCDVITHFAGTNRGDDEHILGTNVGLAQALVDACRHAVAAPHILFASSIYADINMPLENPTRSPTFGTSKNEAERILSEWGNESGARVTIFALPHVFGEFAKPFHNSAVATLCHQLVRGESSQIRAGATVELVYVREVVSLFLEAIKDKRAGRVRIEGVQKSVSDVYTFLSKLYEQYRAGRVTMPCDSPFDVALFATLHYHIVLNILESTPSGGTR